MPRIIHAYKYSRGIVVEEKSYILDDDSAHQLVLDGYCLLVIIDGNVKGTLYHFAGAYMANTHKTGSFEGAMRILTDS